MGETYKIYMIGKIAKRYCNWSRRRTEDDKGPTMLKSEVVKAIKDMRRKKAIGDNNIPVDLLKKLGDGEFKIMTALVNKVYVHEWRRPNNFLDDTMIAFPN